VAATGVGRQCRHRRPEPLITESKAAMLTHQYLPSLAWRSRLDGLIAAGRTHRWLIVRLAVSAGLVTLLLSTRDFGQVMRILAEARPLPLLAAVGLFFFGMVISACRWRLVLGACNPERPSIPSLARLVFIGMFFNLFLPSTVGGDVVRAELTKTYLRGRIESYSCVLFDRFIAFNSILVISFSAAVVARLYLGWFHPYVLAIWLVFFCAGAGFVVTILWFPAHLVPDWGRRGIVGVAYRLFEQAQCALRSFMVNVGLVGRMLLLAVTVQVVGLILPVWLLAVGLGMEVPLLFHLIAVPIIELVSLVPVSFNGIGLRETAYVLFYAGAGVTPEAAIALSFAYTMLLFTSGLFGGLCWLWPGLYVRGRRGAFPTIPGGRSVECPRGG
jgi:uncharacterized protein (TIRG00374 family)